MSKVGFVYRIVSDSCCYIGSTQKPLNYRVNIHKATYKNYLQKNGQYRTQFKVMECPEHKFELLEEVTYNDVRELRDRERYYIENTPGVVNKNIPNRTCAEYDYDNPQQLKERQKRYFSKIIHCDKCNVDLRQSSWCLHKKSLKHNRNEE